MQLPQSPNNPEMAGGYLDHEDAIAIVGIAARLPQDADTPENFWKFLLRARNASTPWPSNRVNHQSHYHPDSEHGGTLTIMIGAHFLTGDPADFDSQFFSLTKTESMTMDPQQRMLLENVYHALENAGIPLHKTMSSMTSVFTSGFNHDFMQIINNDPELSAKYKPTGVANAILANRISWFFDFKGASLAVDTACSSSMVAFHLGCQNLMNRESEMAVVSGVNSLLWPNDFAAMAHQGLLSPDGQCYSFDHKANGYARAEGVATVLLKRLSDALRDGDTIRGIVRGSGLGQDGRTAGITLPSAAAQIDLATDVYRRAGLDPKDTLFVEAHGTGTAAGDPTEARAIMTTFKTADRKDPLYIGAMKSGVGHLEGASGVAGVIKSVMVLESGIIPPNVNFERINPKIPMDKWKLQFPMEPIPWPTAGPRRISINSMGFGGTNSHVILDDAHFYLSSRGLNGLHRTTRTVPSVADIARIRAQLEGGKEDEPGTSATTNGHVNGVNGDRAAVNGVHTNGIKSTNGIMAPAAPSRPFLFLLSAFDQHGLQRNAESLAEYLKSLPPMSNEDEVKYLSDLAFTLSRKRSQFPWRSSCVASSLADAVQSLETGLSKPVRITKTPTLGFVFSGQGAQWYAMGRELMVYRVFSESLRAAEEYFKSQGADWSLIEELHKDKDVSNINEPYVSHAATTALQVAIVDLLASWKIRPTRVVGHSAGEVAAAYSAGKIGRTTAWKVSYYRGILCTIKNPIPGAMMAVGLPEAELRRYIRQVDRKIPGELIIGCYNSPTNQTASGDETKIDALKALLDADSVFARKLVVVKAYHSSHMQIGAGRYLELLGDIRSSDKLATAKNIPMFSTVTGQTVDSATLESAEYWVKNLVSPVSFTKSLASACFQSISKGQKAVSMNSVVDGTIMLNAILEIGPHGVLQSAIKQTISSHNSGATIGCLPVLDRTKPGLGTILTAVGYLHSKGYDVEAQCANENSISVSPQLLVKLPPYSFDHSSKSWYESRITKNLRLRKNAKHDLLGTQVADWNAEEPRWRHILRLSENPWLMDHVITGRCIFPGVGYITRALEAAKQISDPAIPISGYRLRDVSIKTAMIIPDSKDGVEVMTSMSRMDESSIQRSASWWNFRIMSYDPIGSDWTEHCTGYISVETAKSSNLVDADRVAEEESRVWQESLKGASQACQFSLETVRVYENLAKVGLTFGPLFKNLSDIKIAKGLGQATGIVTVPDIASSMPKNFMSKHVFHPCALDSMLQLFFSSVLDCTKEEALSAALLPTFMREVWVSSDISSRPGHAFLAHGRSKAIAAQKYESDLTVWDNQLGKGRLSIKGLKASPLSNTDSTESQLANFCHTMEWKPDMDLLKSDIIPGVQLETREEMECRRREVEDTQLASMLMITDALDELQGKPIESYEGHFQRYYRWLLKQVSALKSDSIPHLPLSRWMQYKDNKEFKERFYQEVAASGPEGAICVRMGTNIAKALRKEVDPLYLMFGMDDLLERVYAEMLGTGNLDRLTRGLLGVIGHNRTDLNILEIGAGTGGSTTAVLEVVSPLPSNEQSTSQSSKIAKYTFTDISAGFFEKAKERFKNWRPIMEFQTLNIEADLQEQGFSKGAYDIIVASNVLHATADLSSTLKNVRSLLKPDGKLLLNEGIRQDILSMPLVFGQLEGWWLGKEDSRQWGPWLTEDQWGKLLIDTSFSGIDVSLKDRPDPDLHGISLLVTSPVGDEGFKSRIPRQTLLITSGKEQDGLAFMLMNRLVHKYGVGNCSIVKYTDLLNRDLSNALCISLVELGHSILADPTEDEYANVRQLLSVCENVLWVTGDITSNPEMNMISGMIRAVRWERDLEKPNLITLAISDPRPSQVVMVTNILNIFEHQFIKATENKENAEYLLQGDIIFTNRLVDATQMNDYLSSKVTKPTAQMMPLGKAETERPLRLTTGGPGMLNKLQFETDPIWYEPLEEYDVEIKVKAVGLNFRDVMIAIGEHNAMALGSEGAGIVTRVGSTVKKVKAGDRVVYMDGHRRTGAFQTYGRAIEQLVAVIPDSTSFEVAASLPSVYVTSLFGLDNVAQLRKGETVLIHSAAGGVGQAAIMLSNIVGAEVFATVSTPEKADLIATKYGVKRDHIFSSRDASFADGVMRMTNGHGIDVVLNSLSGELLRRTWDCMAPFGRFIEIGKKDAQNNGRISLNPFLRHVMMASVDLQTMIKYRPKESVAVLEDVIRLYKEGKIQEPAPINVINYSQLEEAFRLLQSGKGMGKIVLVPSDDAIIPVVPQTLAPPRLQENATYVLSGGTGGIGRSVGLWMASRGAKNIVFLSRSGAANRTAQETIQKLESLGVTARAYACDVSDKDRVLAVLKECENLPPIKGCIQGAMVLADKIFENMSYEKYLAATRPKVQGSWNLHTYLPKDMDFFILLSSVVGLVGNRGQANYAAGNTFQDALAAHRVSIGLPATSLDLGTLLSIGYVAENRQRLGHITHVASLLGSVQEEEIHSMIERHIDPTDASQRPAQITSALTTAAHYASRGMPAPSWMHTPLFTQLASTSSATTNALSAEDSDSGLHIASLLEAAQSMTDASAIIADSIRTKLSRLLSISVENIDPSKSVSSNGVDSLVAVEFRMWLAKVIAADIPLLDILGTMPIGGDGSLSVRVAAISKLVAVDSKKEKEMA
ncbi:hypothetical protein AJ80_03730 [Polytolypa hystricis UAMH7299]|uniref:Uncharacterized protein n=1 Tax=Polytolypa hystricis (strain UAMH7299) TaxID=1447883 RepID=A0A2B7YFW4_POLH7|nr:hypothetical protein AJ80_03730 [Polytolypa hystricis UAMH7299]